MPELGSGCTIGTLASATTCDGSPSSGAKYAWCPLARTAEQKRGRESLITRCSCSTRTCATCRSRSSKIKSQCANAFCTFNVAKQRSCFECSPRGGERGTRSHQHLRGGTLDLQALRKPDCRHCGPIAFPDFACGHPTRRWVLRDPLRVSLQLCDSQVGAAFRKTPGAGRRCTGVFDAPSCVDYSSALAAPWFLHWCFHAGVPVIAFGPLAMRRGHCIMVS